MFEGLQSFWGGAAVVGILAACWTKIKALLYRIVSLLVVTIKVEDDLSRAIQIYCWTNLSRSPFGERRYGSITDYVRPLRRHQVVAYETVGSDPIVFWRRKRWRFPVPLLLGAGNTKDHPGGAHISVTFLRGSWVIDDLLVAAVKLLNDRRHQGIKTKRFRVERFYGAGAGWTRRAQGRDDLKGESPRSTAVESSDLSLGDRRLLGWNPDDIGIELDVDDPWKVLAFPKDVEELIVECQHWLKSRDWYLEKQIPWRRGILLYGLAGTGKTSLVKGIAFDLDLPICVFDLASMSNEDMHKSWTRALREAPCVVLLEDLDIVFAKRTNRLGESGGGLTFDCLLNCLSGVVEASGILCFVTTNRVEELDEALGVPTERGVSTRPGRIDRTLELGLLDEACRAKIARRILSDCQSRITELVILGEGDTGAQFQDRCARVAETEYWERRDGKAERDGKVERDGLANAPFFEAGAVDDVCYGRPSLSDCNAPPDYERHLNI